MNDFVCLFRIILYSATKQKRKNQLMLYPARRRRKQLDRWLAKKRMLYCNKALQRKSTATGEYSKVNKKHVSFSCKLDVCPFNNSVFTAIVNYLQEPPILSFLNRPSHFDSVAVHFYLNFVVIQDDHHPSCRTTTNSL